MNDDANESNVVAARHASNSFELLLRIFHEECDNFRGQVRRLGDGIRSFFRGQLNKKEEYAQELIKLAAKANPLSVDEVPEKPKWKLEEEPIAERRYTIPFRTFMDVAQVMMNDEEEGVVCRLMWLNPKWENMPEYTPVIPKEEDLRDFQLWTRPMGSPCTMAEDDDERLSLPSTRATDWNREKIDTVEEKLALLTKQMQALLQQVQGGTPLPNMRPSPSNSPIHLQSDSSEDEGRGASLPSVVCSPLAGRRNQQPNAVPAVLPPPGPAPPPPPPELFRAAENKPIIAQRSDKILQEQQQPPAPMRPTAADLQNVQLRKVSRSPGGTPQGRKISLDDSFQDKSNIIASALMSRFRAMHSDSFTEEQDEDASKDNSWTDD